LEVEYDNQCGLRELRLGSVVLTPSLVDLFADNVPMLEKLFARQGGCFGFFAIDVVLSCGGLLWKCENNRL
jgi:hypothetical protein